MSTSSTSKLARPVPFTPKRNHSLAPDDASDRTGGAVTGGGSLLSSPNDPLRPGSRRGGEEREGNGGECKTSHATILHLGVQPPDVRAGSDAFAGVPTANAAAPRPRTRR